MISSEGFPSALEEVLTGSGAALYPLRGQEGRRAIGARGPSLRRSKSQGDVFFIAYPACVIALDLPHMP